MDIRKRQPHERQRTVLSKNEVASDPSTRGHDSEDGLLKTILDFLLSLIRTLRSLLLGTNDEQTAQSQDEGEDKSKEVSVLLGYVDKGRIAIHRQKRPNTTRLVLSSNSTDDINLRHAAAAHAFLASASHPRLLQCFNSGPPITLQDAPLGTLTSFLDRNPTYPTLNHPSLPTKTSHLALPLSWLFQTSSALSFLHTHKLTHGSLCPSSLVLQQNLSITLTNFSKSTINGVTNGYPEPPSPNTFGYPITALRYDYFDGEMSANSQALGLSIDVFDFATLGYVLLTRQNPKWELPEGNGTWALEELHEALDQRAPELGDEIVVGYVVRDCWCLVYEEGKIVKEDFEAALSRQGFVVGGKEGDEIEGVEEAVRDFARGVDAGWDFEDDRRV